MPFRYRAKKVFLTFPQCSVEKTVALARVLKLLSSFQLKWAIVAHEKHKDDGDHLHVVASTKMLISSRRVGFFDVIGDKHPNIVNPKYLAKTVKYVIKDDDFVCHGIDPQEFVRLSESKENTGFNQFAKMIHEGSSLVELDTLDNGFMMKNLRRVRDYHGFVSMAKRKAMAPPKKWISPISHRGFEPEFVLPEEMEGWVHRNKLLMEIVTWFNTNVKHPRALGQPNLWLCGGTGVGKTRLKEMLMTMLRVYEAPYDGDWHDEYQDGVYDIVVFDEFNGQHTITHMNRWLGSEYTKLRRRGIAPVTKVDRLPCLVLSNHVPHTCYSKATLTVSGNISVDALTRRVKILDVGTEKIPESFFEAFKEAEVPVLPNNVSLDHDTDPDLGGPESLSSLGDMDSVEFAQTMHEFLQQK